MGHALFRFGEACANGVGRLLRDGQHKDVLILAGAHDVVPQLLVVVGARVGPPRVKVCDVGCRVLVVEKSLQKPTMLNTRGSPESPADLKPSCMWFLGHNGEES